MKADRYASILNAMVETAKERGMQAPGGDIALACYQIIEAAKTEADVWGVPLQEIGLAGFNSERLLQQTAPA